MQHPLVRAGLALVAIIVLGVVGVLLGPEDVQYQDQSRRAYTPTQQEVYCPGNSFLADAPAYPEQVGQNPKWWECEDLEAQQTVAWWTRAIGFLTAVGVALLAFTLLETLQAAHFASETLKQATEQTRIARQQLTSETRPHLYPIFKLSLKKKPGDERHDESIEVGFHFSIRNIGRGPGVLREVHFIERGLYYPIKQAVRLAFPKSFARLDETRGFRSKATRLFSANEPQGIVQGGHASSVRRATHWDRVKRRGMFVTGTIRYEDTGGRLYTRHFCFQAKHGFTIEFGGVRRNYETEQQPEERAHGARS